VVSVAAVEGVRGGGDAAAVVEGVPVVVLEEERNSEGRLKGVGNGRPRGGYKGRGVEAAGCEEHKVPRAGESFETSLVLVGKRWQAKCWCWPSWGAGILEAGSVEPLALLHLRYHHLKVMKCWAGVPVVVGSEGQWAMAKVGWP